MKAVSRRTWTIFSFSEKSWRLIMLTYITLGLWLPISGRGAPFSKKFKISLKTVFAMNSPVEISYSTFLRLSEVRRTFDHCRETIVRSF